MAGRTIEQLRDVIDRNISTLSHGLKEIDMASWTVNSTNLTTNFRDIDINAANELINAARELEALIQGPAARLRAMSFAFHNASVLGSLLEFNIPSLVPLDGTSVSISELVRKTGLNEDKLLRIVRYAITNFILREPQPGLVAHTAASAFLARDDDFVAFSRMITCDMAPFAAALPWALRKWPSSEVMNETGRGVVAWNAGCGPSSLTSREEEDRFYAGVKGFNVARDGVSKDLGGRTGFHPHSFDIGAYPWSEKLGSNAVIVDVGGGSGHVSKVLARLNPGFRLIVQDRPETIERAIRKQNTVNENDGIPSNVRFQSHDIFTSQPVRGADVYFLRHVLHDFPRAEALQCLRCLIPALKSGARVLISEHLLPSKSQYEFGDLSSDQEIRQFDMIMMSFFNAKERTIDEFAALFGEADARLRYNGVYKTPCNENYGILEAIWTV